MMFSRKKQLRSRELLKFNINHRLNLLYAALYVPRLLYFVLWILRPFYERNENWLNKTWRYGFLTIGGGIMHPAEMRAYRAGIKAVIDNFKTALAAERNNEPLAWVEWILNAEIIEAFDIASFNTESLNIFGNTMGSEYPPALIAEAESQGVPVENCSAVKLSVGSYFLKQIPEPTLIIAASHPCDSSISVYQILEYLTGVPTFAYDAPYWKDENSYDYFTKNTWDLIDFLEKQLDKKIDWEKLREVLERVNEINFYLREVCEMNRAVPCPGTMISLALTWVIREVAVRSPLAVSMAKGVYEATKYRFDKGVGVVKNERVRVLMWFPPIGFFTYIFKWMEHEFGAVVVADFIGHISTIHINTETPETMVHDLSRSQLHLGMGRQCHGPVEFIVDELEKMLEDYSADCVFFMGHNGCKHGWAALKIIKDFLKKKGMPALYLNLDIMDKRHTSEQEIKKEITDFFRSHGWA